MHSVTIEPLLQEIAVSLLSKSAKEHFIPLRFEKLAGDGSPRQFYRLFSAASETLVLVLPAEATTKELAESHSAWLIATHLSTCGVPVPDIYGWDEKSGMLLFEDLGNCRLQDVAHGKDGENQYRQVVKELAKMNCLGGNSFQESWCWDTPCYSKSLMLERESGYFLRAFWQNLLDLAIPAGIEMELDNLAGSIALFSTEFFLHRDFQSRNIMVHQGKPRFIDFQGGRKGPLGYDLASLLYDPYVGLPEPFRREMETVYIAELQRHIDISPENFLVQYRLLACMRTLQIIGAFSWLSSVQKKQFFAQFIGPAVHSLSQQLRMELFSSYPVLRKTVERAVEKVDITNR